ncbi:M15 family metallopeptidase domain-containing protein [Flavobacterium subsaxonicum]|uniref:Peptidase M15C domain-containing protein n=1 Tax=Flavobacterium subsaxonicum WB 4.1-42 = DSM 21790 TaxID=1121898 RepID=A0A0A2MS91_9FLAO|nr:M15 family metallopeptidase [Flavobacterium subsaxonicum]KGO94323.1 hypothetical protein Q766_05230 [Flavobacterium subsaxonicum WB 4.1-42 = DSM 21790]
MDLTPQIIKLAQRYLNSKNLGAGTADGIIGNNTKAALNKLPELTKTWTLEKKIVGTVQLFTKSEGFNPGTIDGLWGPQTQTAYDQLRYKLLYGQQPEPWRPEDRDPVNPNNWPVQSQSALTAFYGVPKETGNSNLVSVTVPYPLVIAWDTSKKVTRITAHKKVKDSLLRVLNKTLDHYGIDEIKRLRLDYFGGCFNYRLVRGGTSLSTHSWGIALDFDPENNQLNWGRDKATFARPEYNKWWDFWEEEGWVSLGRDRNYDWMHVQAAKLVS